MPAPRSILIAGLALAAAAGIVAWLAGSGAGPAGDAAPASSSPAPSPAPPGERLEERTAAFDAQLAHPRDGREPIADARVLEAMRAVRRHAFVPADLQGLAYRDSPLPIGHGQTISQPYIVALMTEHLAVSAGTKVLEVGTGSGYQAAVLASLGAQVFTVEVVAALAEGAERALRAEGHRGVRCRAADGYHGWPEEAPFDAIIVTCAAGHLPPPLWAQLRPGGRIVIPIGGPHEVQRLVVATKAADGARTSRSVTAVRFVPMVGKAERESER